MRPLILAAALTAAASLPFATHAAPLVLLVDSFDAPSQFVFDTTTTNGGVTHISVGVPVNSPANTILSRTVTHTLLAGTNAGPPASGSQSNVRVGANPTPPPNTLAVTNTSGRDAQVSVSWSLPAGFLPAFSNVADAAVVFDLLSTDQDVEARLFFDGALLGSRTLAAYNGTAGYPTLVPRLVEFLLTPTQYDTIRGLPGGVLRLQLDGPNGWDLRLDNLRFVIPEPGSLAAVGVALLLLGATTRRRASAARPSAPRS